MCFSPHALYSAPVSLCSSKQLWGKTPRNPGTLTLRTRTGGKLSDLFFLAPESQFQLTVTFVLSLRYSTAGLVRS